MTTPARSVVLLRAGMTHAECARATSCAWWDLTLRFRQPTAGDRAWQSTPTHDEEVLRTRVPEAGSPMPPDAVLISGRMSAAIRERIVRDSFDLVPEFVPRFTALRERLPDTLDAMQEFVWAKRAKFTARHGREPDEGSSFAGLD